MLQYGKWALAGLSALSLAACSGPDRGDQAQQNSGAADVAVTQQPAQKLDNGEIAKDFALNNFTGITLTSADDVRVRQGPNYLIRAIGQAAEVEQMSFKIEDGQLVIGRQSNANVLKDVDVEVVMPSVTKLTVTGSGDLEADQLNGESAALTVTGSGDLDVKGGKVRSADLRVTGSGKIDAEKMQAETLDIALTGSGGIDAFASRTAAITLSGSGDVEVKGGATCKINKMGPGKAVCK